MEESQPPLYHHTKIYKTTDSNVVLFFICPFGTKIWMLRFFIKRLQKEGYTIVAYDVTTDVFKAGNPDILIKLISQIKNDIRNRINIYKNEGIDDFGFFGSSLGSFIFYNCINDIKQLKWGIFNTGGNIAEAMWRIKKARKAHTNKGIDLKYLQKIWHHLQYPNFTNLENHYYLFIGSPGDKIAPVEDVEQYLEPMRKAGADVRLIQVKSFSHLTSVLVGLTKTNILLNNVRNRNGEIYSKVSQRK